MNIIVCIKQVPDTTDVKIDPVTNTLIREGVASVINPFDTYAIEEAVRLKEKFGGKVIILTMGPGPCKLDGTTWEAEKKGLMERIIKYYSQRYLPGLEEHIRVAEFSTPADFEKRLLSPGGAIYALRQDVPHSICFRPAAKSKSIKGLYLVGASTHPGGGIPVVTASAMNGADLIAKYEK